MVELGAEGLGSETVVSLKIPAEEGKGLQAHAGLSSSSGFMRYHCELQVQGRNMPTVLTDSL